MKEIFTIDSALSYQESNWKKRKNSIDWKCEHALPFITISREYGCLGFSVGEAVAKILNKEYRHEPQWGVFERRLLDRLTEDMNISRKLLETLTDKAKSSMSDYVRMTFTEYPPEAVVYKKLVETIQVIAANGHAIIIGRVGNMITKGMPCGYHVRLVASDLQKINNMSSQFSIPLKEAKKLLKKKGEAREQFILKHLKVDLSDPSIYNIIINTSDISVEETARFIVKGMESYGIVKPLPRSR